MDKRELEYYIGKFLNSPERNEVLTGKRYYYGVHDILTRKRQVIGASGALESVENLPNAHIVDNQYRKLVDQKTNYALGKPITIATDNETYSKELEKIFDKKLHKKIRTLGKAAIEGGIAWLHPYYDGNGDLKFKVFPAEEVLPFWKDAEHTELECAVRIYPQAIFNNGVENVKTVAEVYDRNGVTRYFLKGSSLVSLGTEPNFRIDDRPFNWQRIPIIPFKYNSEEIPLIRGVKTLQDSLNEIMSDFQNNMQEDPRNTILVLENYDGENLASFRRNLATYGAIKVRTIDGVKGGVSTLKIDVDANNYKSITTMLRRSIIENGRGFDAREERLDGDPNLANILSMYSDIDLDVNGMETEFQSGFEDMIWFINQHLVNKGLGDFSNERVEFIFNRDIYINQSDTISNCQASMGILSRETIVAQHPWTTSVRKEMQRIEAEEKQELEMYSAGISSKSADGSNTAPRSLGKKAPGAEDKE